MRQVKGDVQIGYTIVLNDGRSGKVHCIRSRGEITLISGNELIECFFPGDIEKIIPPQCVRIYQLEPESEFTFRDYAFCTARGLAHPPAESYEVVFDGQLETDSPERIFEICNAAHPEGYAGRSLSPSDIVEIYDGVGSRFYFCDNIGFKEVPFNPVTFSYILITANERETVPPTVFSTFDEAFCHMRDNLLSNLESLDEHNRYDDYDLNNSSAWSNYRDNIDWTIFRLATDRDGNVTSSLVPEKKLVIWTHFTTPFGFGNPRYPKGCEVGVVEKLALGHGYFCYRVPMPNGADVFCECHSGAIIGNSLDTVREDVRAGDTETMRKQVMTACKERERVEIVDPEEFWDVYCKSIAK